MKSFTIEHIDKVLSYEGIKKYPVVEIGGEFQRFRKFHINNIEYIIEWYCNTSYLHCLNITIPFIYAELSNTWPHHSKMNIQFYNGNNEICCILKIK